MVIKNVFNGKVRNNTNHKIAKTLTMHFAKNSHSNKNIFVTVGLILVYFLIFIIVLNDYGYFYLFLPAVIIVIMLKVLWESSHQILSALVVFLTLFIAFTIFTYSYNNKASRDLQFLYNLYQMRRIADAPNMSNIKNSNAYHNYNMFFLESNHQRELLSTKQLCSVESAAKNNPRATVYLLTVRAGLPQKQLLDKYPNFKIQKLVAFDLFNQTPLNEWWIRGKVFKSEYTISHVTDAARFALMWKYGGIYSDLDTITLRSFENLMNYSGAGYLYEYGDSLGSGVLIFNRPKHPMLNLTLRKLVDEYDPKMWGSAGPITLINSFKQFCKSDNFYDSLMLRNDRKQKGSQEDFDLEEILLDINVKQNNDNCKDLTVFPEHYFYPYNYQTNMRDIFKENAKMDLKKFKNAYSLHFYGKLSSNFTVKPGDSSVYDFLASMHCPIVYDYVKSNNLIFE
jgi:lactosylceramide 4-alpha-galactosyltransferase